MPTLRYILATNENLRVGVSITATSGTISLGSTINVDMWLYDRSVRELTLMTSPSCTVHRIVDGNLQYLTTRNEFSNLTTGDEYSMPETTPGSKVYRKELTIDTNWKPGKYQVMCYGTAGEIVYYGETSFDVSPGNLSRRRGH